MNPSCHPDRRYNAKGLCKNCYTNQWKIAKRRSLGIGSRKPEVRSFIVYLYYDLIIGKAIYVGEGTMDRAVSHKYSYRNSSWCPKIYSYLR